MQPGNAELQPKQVISANRDRLRRAKKVLYMTHLALGDYVYQRACLKALTSHYPQIELDIWIDDCRFRQKDWHQDRNSTLCQWLESEPFINNIYPIAAGPKERKQLIKKAALQQYDVVFFIALHRASRFASIARQIAGPNIAIGAKTTQTANPFMQWLSFSKLDSLLIHPQHAEIPIGDWYAHCFNQCTGIQIAQAQRLANIAIPQHFLDEAKEKAALLRRSTKGKILFINHLSTNNKRDYGWHKLREVLLGIWQKYPTSSFFINLPPAHVTSVKAGLNDDRELAALPIEVFSATDHFYQLPALIQASDLTISVETAVMHLASALGKSQLVLMRQSAGQWLPPQASKVLFGEKRVDQIPVHSVIEAALDLLD